MCVGSRLLAATSASIGVNSSALASLISVNSTDGSGPNRRSRRSAVATPAKPPPRITTRVLMSRPGGVGVLRTQPPEGQITQRLSQQPQSRAVEDPAHQPRKQRQHTLGRPLRLPARQQRQRYHADPRPEWHAQRRGDHAAVYVCARRRTKGQSIADARDAPQQQSQNGIVQRRGQNHAARCPGQQADNRTPHVFVHDIPASQDRKGFLPLISFQNIAKFLHVT
jgi:hypothetical protein